MRSKYRATKTTIKGETFDSKAEARRYKELKLLERGGKISELRCHPRYKLLDPYANGLGIRVRPIFYEADFSYKKKETGGYVVEDVKGVRTEVFKIKKKLFEKKYFPLTITEVKA